MGTKDQKTKFHGTQNSDESHKTKGPAFVKKRGSSCLVRAAWLQRGKACSKNEFFHYPNKESEFTINFCVHMKGITTTWAYSAL